MKLVFPGGEHPQVLLGPGVNRVGSDPQANIVLDEPGVLPQHCQLHVSPGGVMLEVPLGTTVSVNGRRVDGLIALRSGDSVTFDQVVARLAAVDAVGMRPAGERSATALPTAANDDPGVTAVRQVMPMYVLRGVTGGAFGRSYPLQGPVTIGRSPECALHINDPGLSRIHARLVPAEDGVQIEDLDSTNGSFINDRRVMRETARLGDEIGFDKLRFRLVGSGAHAEPVHIEATRPRAAAPRSGLPWLWIGIALAVLAAVATIALQ